MLLPFIEQFNKKHPKIYIDITDANSQKLQKYLKNGTIDLAILNLPITEQGFYNITEVTTTQDCFIAPKNFEKDYLQTDTNTKIVTDFNPSILNDKLKEAHEFRQSKLNKTKIVQMCFEDFMT